MTPAERLEYVQRGLAQGKTQRAIARELGVDEGTVRRDLKKLQLPPQDLAKVQQGAAAEAFLRGARALRRQWKSGAAEWNKSVPQGPIAMPSPRQG